MTPGKFGETALKPHKTAVHRRAAAHAQHCLVDVQKLVATGAQRSAKFCICPAIQVDDSLGAHFGPLVLQPQCARKSFR